MWTENEIQEAMPIMSKDLGLKPEDCIVPSQHDCFATAVSEYYMKVSGHLRMLQWKLLRNNPNSDKDIIYASNAGEYDHIFDTKRFRELARNVTTNDFFILNRIVIGFTEAHQDKIIITSPATVLNSVLNYDKSCSVEMDGVCATSDDDTID